MRIIAWRCRICSEEFETNQGAVCSRCNNPTCDEHLKLVNYKEKDGAAKPDQIVCDRCLKDGESHIKFENRFLSKTSLGRIFG